MAGQQAAHPQQVRHAQIQSELALLRARNLRGAVESGQVLDLLLKLYQDVKDKGEVESDFLDDIERTLIAHGMIEGEYTPLKNLPFGEGL